MLILQHLQEKPKWDSTQASTQRQGCKTYGLWNFSTRGLSMRSAFLCKSGLFPLGIPRGILSVINDSALSIKYCDNQEPTTEPDSASVSEQTSSNNFTGFDTVLTEV